MKNIFVLLFTFISVISSAQKVGEFIIIKSTDDNTYQGKVVESDDDYVKLATESIGEIKIERSRIKSISTTSKQDIEKGTTPMHSAFATRYYFGPSSFGLKKGEGYYQNLNIFYNHVSYGISDHFTVGGTVFPLFLFGAPTPVGITAKYHGKLAKNVTGSIGVLGLGILGDGEFIEGASTLGGIAFATATIGSRRKNFTIGGGLTSGGNPVLCLSGQLPLSRKFFLVTENYIASGEWATITGGRYMFNQVGFDFGLLRLPGFDVDIVGIPYVGITLPFGNKSDYPKPSKTKKRK